MQYILPKYWYLCLTDWESLADSSHVSHQDLTTGYRALFQVEGEDMFRLEPELWLKRALPSTVWIFSSLRAAFKTGSLSEGWVQPEICTFVSWQASKAMIYRTLKMWWIREFSIAHWKSHCYISALMGWSLVGSLALRYHGNALPDWKPSRVCKTFIEKKLTFLNMRQFVFAKQF